MRKMQGDHLLLVVEKVICIHIVAVDELATNRQFVGILPDKGFNVVDVAPFRIPDGAV